MKKNLLTIVICPHCRKKKLMLKHAFAYEFGEVIDGVILCSHCDSWYPIIKGIPRLLPEELKVHILKEYNQKFLERYKEYLPQERDAKKLLEKETRAKVQTSDAFGYEWTHWPEARKKHYEQFIHWTEPYAPEYFKGKTVLDAGCGTGNHSSYMAEWGATIFGIDLSEAITVVYENKNLFKPNAHFIQADLYHPPFEENFFDFIYSQGVLHHLPQPEQGFATLVKYLKKGGIILIRMYGKEENFFMIYIIEKGVKKIMRFLKFSVIETLAYTLAIALYLITSIVYKPIYALDKEVAKKILPYHYYLVYISQFSFYQLHSIIFDLLIAPLAFYYTKEGLLEWYEKCGLKVVHILGKDEGAWRIAGEKIKK